MPVNNLTLEQELKDYRSPEIAALLETNKAPLTALFNAYNYIKDDYTKVRHYSELVAHRSYHVLFPHFPLFLARVSLCLHTCRSSSFGLRLHLNPP